MKKKMIRKEMLYSLLIPYILLGIMGGIVFVGMYKTSVNNTIQEEITDSRSIFSKVIREVEYLINDVERLAMQIEGNNRFNRLIDIESDQKEAKDSYEIALGVRELKNIQRYNHLIEDVILYYAKGEFFINSRGLRDGKIIYEDYEVNTEMEYSEWEKSIIYRYEEPALIKLGKHLFYVVSVPFNEIEERSNIIIKINTLKFQELISSYSNLNRGTIYILDNNDNLIASNNWNDIDIKKTKVIKKIDNEDGLVDEIKVGKQAYIRLFEQGEKLKIKYIWLIDKSVLYTKSNYILTAFLGIGTVFIVLLGLGIYGVKKNYNKISDIVERLKKSKLISEAPMQSEMNYINSALSDIEEKIESQDGMKVEAIIRESFYGFLEKADENHTYIMENHPKLCENTSIIAVFEEDTERFTQASELKLNRFVIDNIVKEVFGEGSDTWIISIEKWQVLVINGDLEEEYGMDYILDCIERIRRFLADHMNIVYTIGISSLDRGVDKFSQLYRQAIQSVEEKQIVGGGQVIYYGNIQERNNQYHYDEFMRTQLINYIKLGNKEKAREFIERSYQENFEEMQISAECGKLFILELVETVLGVAKELSYQVDINLIDIVEKKYSLHNVKEKLHTIVVVLCEKSLCNKENEQKRDERILKYIQENYKDTNLNVAMVAEKFNLNAAYLSRIFKEETGENLLAYINSYRVEQAKSLIMVTHSSMNNIAIEVGFTNVAALTRAFKKYEGITPGQYKEIYKKED